MQKYFKVAEQGRYRCLVKVTRVTALTSLHRYSSSSKINHTLTASKWRYGHIHHAMHHYIYKHQTSSIHQHLRLFYFILPTSTVYSKLPFICKVEDNTFVLIQISGYVHISTYITFIKRSHRQYHFNKILSGPIFPIGTCWNFISSFTYLALGFQDNFFRWGHLSTTSGCRFCKTELMAGNWALLVGLC